MQFNLILIERISIKMLFARTEIVSSSSSSSSALSVSVCSMYYCGGVCVCVYIRSILISVRLRSSAFCFITIMQNVCIHFFYISFLLLSLIVLSNVCVCSSVLSMEM